MSKKYRMYNNNDIIEGTLDELMEAINNHPKMVSIKKSKVGTEAVRLVSGNESGYDFDLDERIKILECLTSAAVNQDLAPDAEIYVIMKGNSKYAFVLDTVEDAQERAVGFAAEWSDYVLKEIKDEEPAKAAETHKLPPDVLKNLKKMSQKTGYSVPDLVEMACRNYYTAFDIFGDLIKWPYSAR